jgi:hypothetical protein
MQLMRIGNYAGVRYDIKSAKDDFEIYDVVKDPEELNNLAAKPGFEKMQMQMKASVLQARHADAEAPRPYDNALIPSIKVSGKLSSGFIREFFAGDFPWVISEKGLKPQNRGISSSIKEERTNETGMVLCRGFIKVPADGQYSFSLKTSGRAYMRLHDASLFDADFGYQPEKELIQDVFLKEGHHPISV